MKRVFGPISAVAAAALIAAAITVLPAASKVVASTPAETPASSAAIGTSCSEQAWPYTAANCVSDQRTGGKAKPARIVSADRMHLSKGKATADAVYACSEPTVVMAGLVPANPPGDVARLLRKERHPRARPAGPSFSLDDGSPGQARR